MGQLRELVRNPVLLSAIGGWFLAQMSKLVLHMLLNGQMRLERLWGAGGMPSAHAATTCALTIAMARVYGVASPVFALAVMFAFVTMYDAMGVRREAGEHAKLLNKYLRQQLRDADGTAGGEGAPQEGERKKEIDLKEFIGHTPLEVLGGVLLGILVGIVVPSFA